MRPNQIRYQSLLIINLKKDFFMYLMQPMAAFGRKSGLVSALR